MFFKGGRGIDFFQYSGEVGDNLKAVTSNGRDGVVLAFAEIGNEARFSTGGGDDIIAIGESEIGQDIEANTGGGDDIILLDTVEVDEDINAKTGSGNDFFAAIDVDVAVEANLNFGSGNDDFYENGSDALSLRINGGSGFDRTNVPDLFVDDHRGFEDSDADAALEQKLADLFN